MGGGPGEDLVAVASAEQYERGLGLAWTGRHLNC
jgi:hypothetical protein